MHVKNANDTLVVLLKDVQSYRVAHIVIYRKCVLLGVDGFGRQLHDVRWYLGLQVLVLQGILSHGLFYVCIFMFLPLSNPIVAESFLCVLLSRFLGESCTFTPQF